MINPKDLEQAHAEGLHRESPREFCPLCKENKDPFLGFRCGPNEIEESPDFYDDDNEPLNSED